MKITMNIDGALLERVMIHSGARTKTQAVDLALREFDRRSKLNALLEKGMGDLSSREIKQILDPHFDLAEMRAAEAPAPYEAKGRRSRR